MMYKKAVKLWGSGAFFLPPQGMYYPQYGTILDVEIIFNERGSKVNNATARVQTKKAPTVPQAAALRGVTLPRGRARPTFPASAAAAAFARLPSPITGAAGAANALHGFTPMYYDPFLAAAAASQAVAAAPLLKTPLSQAQQAYSAAAATYTAVAGMRAAYGAAAAAQPVAGYAAVAGLPCTGEVTIVLLRIRYNRKLNH
ncbi:RNA binding protein fox-1 like 3 [Pseudolycoriella hygida]|uniref:RNA binding protein fox-1 like 3 n=1 Tax=Pseudolycoriella hygida TaxID=35572 RepID=A0A9Q0MYT6_9DIPT|nr:RNA binding protein fox-1 like 3 [Pseudolycoriella hygida]